MQAEVEAVTVAQELAVLVELAVAELVLVEM